MRRAPLTALALALASLLVACGGGGGPEPTLTAANASPAVSSPVAALATGLASTPDQRPGTPALETPTPASGASVTISAVGDVSLARQLNDRMAVAGAFYPYERIAPLLAGDILVGNLEGALTERGAPWPKGYNFRTPPRFAPGLAQAGFDVVSLANNHTMDFGADGLLDTVAALRGAGVRYAGAGPDAASARAPVVVDVRGIRVAFLAYVQTPTESGGFAIDAWAAAPGAPGVALPGDTMEQEIASAREQADFVIVLVHAGSEYVTRPDATQRTIAERALNAGATAYIGAHAHVPQPVEQRGGQLIAWGLGNFIFDLDDVDLANIPQPRVSLVLNLTLTPGAGVTAFEIRPVVLDDAEDRPRPANAQEAAVLERYTTP